MEMNTDQLNRTIDPARLYLWSMNEVHIDSIDLDRFPASPDDQRNTDPDVFVKAADGNLTIIVRDNNGVDTIKLTEATAHILIYRLSEFLFHAVQHKDEDGWIVARNGFIMVYSAKNMQPLIGYRVSILPEDAVKLLGILYRAIAVMRVQQGLNP